VAGGRYTGGRDQLLHPGLGALETGAVGTGSEDEPAVGTQTISETVDERDLGSDDEQVRVDLVRWRVHAAGNPGVPRADDDLCAPTEHVCESVLPTSAADHADLHRENTFIDPSVPTRQF